MARSITDIATRHQVMLERLKAGKAKDYRVLAKKFEADLLAAANRLGVDSLDQLTKKELNLLISNVTKLNKKYQAAIVKDLDKDLRKLAKDDAIFERQTINSFLVTGNAASAANLAYAAAIASPISATGELLEPFIKNWSRTRVTQVSGVIRKGYEQVETALAEAGDIVCINGIDGLGISDTLCDPDHVEALPALSVDEPTVSMTFIVNNSPFA